MSPLVPGEWTLLLVQDIERLTRDDGYLKVKTKGFRYAFITCDKDNKTTVLDVKAFLECIGVCGGATVAEGPANCEKTPATWYDAIREMGINVKRFRGGPVGVTVCQEAEIPPLLSMVEVSDLRSKEYLKEFGRNR